MPGIHPRKSKRRRINVLEASRITVLSFQVVSLAFGPKLFEESRILLGGAFLYRRKPITWTVCASQFNFERANRVDIALSDETIRPHSGEED